MGIPGIHGRRLGSPDDDAVANLESNDSVYLEEINDNNNNNNNSSSNIDEQVRVGNNKALSLRTSYSSSPRDIVVLIWDGSVNKKAILEAYKTVKSQVPGWRSFKG